MSIISKYKSYDWPNQQYTKHQQNLRLQIPNKNWKLVRNGNAINETNKAYCEW